MHKYHLFLFFKGAPPGGPNYHGHQQGPPMQGLMPGQGPMGRPPGHLGGNYFYTLSVLSRLVYREFGAASASSSSEGTSFLSRFCFFFF